MGQTQRGKTNILKVMLNHLLREGTERVGLFDSIDRGLSQYAQETKVSYLDTKKTSGSGSKRQKPFSRSAKLSMRRPSKMAMCTNSVSLPSC